MMSMRKVAQSKIFYSFVIRLILPSSCHILCLQLPVDRKVPSSWMKVNSTKKTIRYHTPEVSKNLENLLLAKEKLAVICRTTWNNFLMDFGRYYAQFQATVKSLATLDCLYSLATLAKQNVIDCS